MGTQAEKDELYALDISGVEWLSAPGTEEAEERVEIAHLPGGAVAWAAGAQYREDTFEATYSDLNNFAVTPCVASVGTGIIGSSACTPRR